MRLKKEGLAMGEAAMAVRANGKGGKKGSPSRKKQVSLAGCGGAEYAVVKIADPYQPEEPLAVVKNIRVHPLDYLEKRGRVTTAQKAAGDWFLEIYERAEIGGARAIDYERVKVDVSFVHRGIPKETAEAVQQLAAIRLAIGATFYRVLLKIIGEKMMPADLGREWDKPWKLVAGVFRLALDDLADFRGAAKGPAKGRVRACRVDDKIDA